MKTLLLTDIPPTHSYTAGLVTAQICRAMKPGELAAFVIMNGELRPARPDDLAWIPIAFTMKPSELGNRRLGRWELGEFAAFVNETRTRWRRTADLIDQAVDFGRAQGVTQVWAILQGQTMVRVSRRVARKLGVPLKTQIWDPLAWWHRAWGVDRVNRFLDNREWKRTLRESRIVASASPAMSRDVTERFGTESFPIIAAVDADASHEAASDLHATDELSIGMAGQFYAVESWLAFCEALRERGWRVGDRKVVLHVLGSSPPPNQIPEANLRFHGWLDQTDAIKKLASVCDVLYCPYPFAEDMADVSRLSFPSKIVIYLAAGRPIFFHGPEYSSPRSYLLQTGAAVTCETLAASAIVDALSRLVNERGLYQQLSAAARQAFLQDFTSERQRALVRRFMETDAAPSTLSSAPAASPSIVTADAFDPWFYLQHAEDVRTWSGSILDHYLTVGWRQHLDPNPWFSVSSYLETYADVAASGAEPLGHYLAHGRQEGRTPTPLFSPSFYRARYLAGQDARADPFLDFQTRGWREGRDPSPWFSTSHYGSFERQNGIDDPLTHYAQVGWRQGREPNDWFSPDWYLDANPDVRAAGIEPLQHYVKYGWREHRNPNDWFCVAFYLAQNPDVARTNAEPIAHYLQFGKSEKRATKPVVPSEAGRLINLAERILVDVSNTIQDDLGANYTRLSNAVACHFELLREINGATQAWLSRRLDEVARSEDDAI